MTLKQDLYTDLPTIFFNQDDFAELHDFTVSDGTPTGTLNFRALGQFDSDELLRLKEAFQADSALARASLLLLIEERFFKHRPRARQNLIIDGQSYNIEKVDWTLGMLSIALSAASV